MYSFWKTWEHIGIGLAVLFLIVGVPFGAYVAGHIDGVRQGKAEAAKGIQEQCQECYEGGYREGYRDRSLGDETRYPRKHVEYRCR